ncbi:acyl-CoA dehydrogenase family protein [Streptomyces sp. NPDC058232]|uniref:acyl-CoA dehydrogenase family protein n=1 Tax=Streptomyces sp. NPDC058232 TaxID=3346393 RepID=UPI0036EC12B0
MAQQSTRAFGMPLAAFQLIRHRLSRMLADITDMLSMQYRLSQLLDAGDYSMPRVAPAKMHDTERAWAVLAGVRDMLGGNGILLDHHVGPAPVRHQGHRQLRRHRHRAGADRRRGNSRHRATSPRRRRQS